MNVSQCLVLGYSRRQRLYAQVGSPTPIGYSAEIEIELRYLSTFKSENCMQN